jgi:hypothetical protein
MSEDVSPAEAVLVDWRCDICGEFVAVTKAKPDYCSTPIRIPHACPNGHEVYLPNEYPRQAMRRRLTTELTSRDH